MATVHYYQKTKATHREVTFTFPHLFLKKPYNWVTQSPSSYHCPLPAHILPIALIASNSYSKYSRLNGCDPDHSALGPAGVSRKYFPHCPPNILPIAPISSNSCSKYSSHNGHPRSRDHSALSPAGVSRK